MESNTKITSETKPPVSKNLIGIMLVICLLIGSLAWYFLYFTKTPEYSLNIIKESVEKHDVSKFKKHVDLDSTLSRGYDDLILAMIESDKTMSLEGKAFVGGLAQMFKQPVVGALKDGLLRFVETGKWEDEKAAQATNKNNKESQQNINPDKVIDQSGLKNSSFRGVSYTKKEGKTATVGLKVFENEANKEFILDIKMRELDDGTWQIAEISNLKDYISGVEKAKNELVKKYIEETKPIIDKHNKTANDIYLKFDTIDKSSNLTDESKRSEIKNIIENEMITDWNARVEELNNVKIPEAAKELHTLRLKVCELRIKQFTKGIELIQTKKPQTENEIKTIVEQINITNQQVLNIINNAKSK